jgi:Arc/MetJ-type ribon-helix-helix transcriptional regulator
VKKKLNRSELIREHLRTARDTNPTAVVAALAKKGVKVSTGLVSVVKHSRRNGFKAKRLVRHAEELAKHADALNRARRFVEQAGGLEEARVLVEVVGKIMG